MDGEGNCVGAGLGAARAVSGFGEGAGCCDGGGMLDIDGYARAVFC